MNDVVENVTYFSGLDLGQVDDYSALTVMERRVTQHVQRGLRVIDRTSDGAHSELIPADPPRPSHLRHLHRSDAVYAVRHLERFRLGTSYTVIVDRVVDLFSRTPLSNSNLAVDQTGVGRAVVNMLVKAKPQANIRPITITAGSAVTVVDNGWNVAKKELVSVLQTLLQSRRIKIASSLPQSQVLVKELGVFKVKITLAGNESFEAWRSRDHDDLVLAVAMAAWVGERGTQEFWYR